MHSSHLCFPFLTKPFCLPLGQKRGHFIEDHMKSSSSSFTPTLVCRSVCSSASQGMHLSTLNFAAKGWDSPMKTGESGITNVWPSVHQHKLLSHPKCITGVQRATKPCRGVSPPHAGCVTMSSCSISSHLWLALGQLSHSWDMETPGLSEGSAQGRHRVWEEIQHSHCPGGPQVGSQSLEP